jgi:hypothetical protein
LGQEVGQRDGFHRIEVTEDLHSGAPGQRIGSEEFATHGGEVDGEMGARWRDGDMPKGGRGSMMVTEMMAVRIRRKGEVKVFLPSSGELSTLTHTTQGAGTSGTIVGGGLPTTERVNKRTAVFGRGTA